MQRVERVVPAVPAVREVELTFTERVPMRLLGANGETVIDWSDCLDYARATGRVGVRPVSLWWRGEDGTEHTEVGDQTIRVRFTSGPERRICLTVSSTPGLPAAA
jgi:hypothetical protein